MMDASVAGVVGTAIGALGAVTGGWVSVLAQGRAQQRQLQYDREHRREAARREAYGGLIASTKLLSAAWWRFSDVLWNEQSTPEQWRTSFSEAHRAWTQFSTAVAAVVVAGPVSAAEEAAEVLRVTMYDWEKAGMDWFAAALREGHGQVDERVERFNRCAEAKRSPTAPFSTPRRWPWEQNTRSGIDRAGHHGAFSGSLTRARHGDGRPAAQPARAWRVTREVLDDVGQLRESTQARKPDWDTDAWAIGRGRGSRN